MPSLFRFHAPQVDVFIPDGVDLSAALQRTTHVGIVAHQDDLEFGALSGIGECYGRADAWFLGVVCTDSPSIRPPQYASLSAAEFSAVRVQEQRAAACEGKYSAVIQLGFPSSSLAHNLQQLEGDIEEVLGAISPKKIYVHAPTDKHPTHIRVCKASVAALKKRLSNDQDYSTSLQEVLGCEGWRGLDWVPEQYLTRVDISEYQHLATKLFRHFVSQLTAGKNYEQAVLGRWAANATFCNPRVQDGGKAIQLAVNMLPLLRESKSLEHFALELVEALKGEVEAAYR